MPKMLRVLIFLCISVCFSTAKHEIYDGHSLFKIDVKDQPQADLVNNIENYLNLDVWSLALPGKYGEVLVPGIQTEKFQEILEEAGITYSIVVENIKEQLELEDKLLAAGLQRNRTETGSLPLDTIYRYDVIDAYLVELANRYPNIVTVHSAGRSFEGRDIKYLKISTTNFQDQSKPVVMMQSLLHCREWVGLSVTLYTIQRLVIDGADQDMLQNIDWIIMPIANPDGYEFSHESSRFWRKNRATGYFTNDWCMGVDLNRNFDIHWSTASSNNPCTDTFHGSRSFSEPETSAIRDIILEHRHRMALFLDIHSFGSMILYGYGNGVLPPNGLLLHVAGIQMAEAIDARKWDWKPDYIVGNVRAVLYAASGSAQDFAQSVGAQFSYTYELPAFNNIQNTLNGFLVDPDFIEQAGFETWEGIKVGATYAVRNFRR